MKKQKIVSLDELADICKENKKEGKKIVQCHGCFDLLHPGHILHFKAAKKYGDVLCVTVTPDQFVKKGPGRPVFNEQLRMESIASLESVDYVALNKWDTAIKTLELIKPDYYVKGKDYSNRSEDITGNILLEENAVLKSGGALKFTDEITFSSSNIINSNFNILSNEAKEYLEKLKEIYSIEDVIQPLKDLKDLNVLVIGEAIIDEYVFCRAMGKPEKAAVVSTKHLYHETYAGGSLAVANHIANFVKSVKLVSYVGEKNSYKSFIQKNIKKNIETNFFPRKDGPTVVKRRYLEVFNNSKLFEVSEISDNFIDGTLEKGILDFLDENLSQVDMVIVTDFGHGLMTPNLKKELCSSPIFTAVNAQTNSANHGFNPVTRYTKADFLSIDEKELRLPYAEKYGQIEPLIKRLSKDTQCTKINVTLGPRGSIYYQDDKEYYVPVFSDRIVDSVGAGDAVLAITSLLVHKKTSPRLIPFVGNSVGAIAVQTMGNKESINPVELFSFIKYILK